MTLFLAIIVLVILSSLSIRNSDGWRDSYISINQSRNIEGIFVILIFMGHVFWNFNSFTPLDVHYLSFWSHLNQAVVAMFMFYSGFGLTQSVKTKGIGYLKALPKKRIFPLLFKYWISFFIFLMIRFLISNPPDPKTLLPAFIGWEDIGNYGWFVFVIVSLYVIFGLSFFIAFKTGNKRFVLLRGAVVLTALSLLYIVLLRFPGHRGKWVYDTVLIFSLGSWYSVTKEKCECFLESNLRYILALLVCVSCYILTAIFRDLLFLIHEIFMFCFTLIIILITIKIQIKSKILEFFGNLAFPMILFQGSSFAVFTHFKINTSPLLYVVLSFILTVLLSVLFDKAYGYVSLKRQAQVK